MNTTTPQSPATATIPPTAEMERAVRDRDATYDGLFVFAVRTTGIFCRPSCPARKPKIEHVKFYPGEIEARRAGFRPCKRCRPTEPAGREPDWVKTLLEAADRAPGGRLKDAEIADLGIDPARARRHFLKAHGKTFQAYCRDRRLGEALGRLKIGEEIDDVATTQGFESHSGFRDAFGRTFGTPPGKARDSDCVVSATIETPIGPLVLGATGEGICLVEFADPPRLESQLASLRKALKMAIVPGDNAHLDHLRRELAEYFAGHLRDFTVPLVLPGTAFQRLVWESLRQIPYGETRSYEDIARSVGVPGASRAVGRSNGLNRACIVVPCHRVVNKSGELGGYGGGLWRKRRLLDLERRASE